MEIDLVSVISRFVHVAIAIILVGGTTFFRFVLHPVLAGQHPELLNQVRGRWKQFVHGGIALFLLSGGYNYYQAITPHTGDGLYHALVGTKIILALVVFFLASALVGRSAGTQKFRDQAPKWTAIMLAISFLIVGMSSFVKVRGIPAPKPATSSATSPTEGQAP